MHHFFLTMVSLRHIVSAFFVSKFFICFAIKSSRTKTILSRPLEFRSLLRGGKWYPTILNWWFGKLDLVLFHQYKTNLFLLSLKSSLSVLAKSWCWGRQSNNFFDASQRLIRTSRSDFRSFVWCKWFSQKRLLSLPTKKLFTNLIKLELTKYLYPNVTKTVHAT